MRCAEEPFCPQCLNTHPCRPLEFGVWLEDDYSGSGDPPKEAEPDGPQAQSDRGRDQNQATGTADVTLEGEKLDISRQGDNKVTSWLRSVHREGSHPSVAVVRSALRRHGAGNKIVQALEDFEHDARTEETHSTN